MPPAHGFADELVHVIATRIGLGYWN